MSAARTAPQGAQAPSASDPDDDIFDLEDHPVELVNDYLKGDRVGFVDELGVQPVRNAGRFVLKIGDCPLYRRFDNRKCLIVQEWKGVETFEKAFFGAPLVPSTIKLNDARRNMCFRIASEDGILVYFEPDPSSIWVVSIAFFREWAETGVRPPRPQLWVCVRGCRAASAYPPTVAPENIQPYSALLAREEKLVRERVATPIPLIMVGVPPMPEFDISGRNRPQGTALAPVAEGGGYRDRTISPSPAPSRMNGPSRLTPLVGPSTISESSHNAAQPGTAHPSLSKKPNRRPTGGHPLSATNKSTGTAPARASASASGSNSSMLLPQSGSSTASGPAPAATKAGKGRGPAVQGKGGPTKKRRASTSDPARRGMGLSWEGSTAAALSEEGERQPPAELGSSAGLRQFLDGLQISLYLSDEIDADTRKALRQKGIQTEYMARSASFWVMDPTRMDDWASTVRGLNQELVWGSYNARMVDVEWLRLCLKWDQFLIPSPWVYSY